MITIQKYDLDFEGFCEGQDRSCTEKAVLRVKLEKAGIRFLCLEHTQEEVAKYSRKEK